jgi:hypothetical protein
MRRVSLAVGALLVAGCATGGGASRVAAERPGEPPPPPKRCSPADPDRWAWFCVIGQLLYTVGGALQPESELRR